MLGHKLWVEHWESIFIPSQMRELDLVEMVCQSGNKGDTRTTCEFNVAVLKR